MISTYCANHDLPEIATRLKARIYPRLEPGLRRRLARGQTVYFGSLSISQTGIKWKKQAYAWEKVHRIEIKKGYLWIYLVGQHLWQLPISEIPNLELLMDNIKRMHPTIYENP